MSKSVEITDATFDQFVKDHPKVVVDCWAAWCAPCRMLSPTIDELAGERTDITFAKLDVDHSRAVPMKYGIMSIPHYSTSKTAYWSTKPSEPYQR